MLIEKQGLIVPYDTPDSLVTFIKNNNDATRFLIGMYIQKGFGKRERFEHCIDEAYFCIGWRAGEVRFRSRAHARHHEIPYYGLDHIEFVIPNTKKDIKHSKNFWIKDGALKRILPNLPTHWRWGSFAEWLELHPRIKEEQLYG